MAGIFTKDLFDFLRDLEKNNDRRWFKANKHRYEEHVKEPFLEFITAVDAELAKINRNIVADPRPSGGSMFRIYRDTRFSKDKTPYKTNAGAHFQVGGKGVHGPGYYLHIDRTESFVGGGMWMPGSPQLKMIRDRIIAKPAEWKKAKKAFTEHEEYRLKRPPKGYDPDHPLIEDLKNKSFTGGVSLTQKQITSPDFPKTFISGCKEVTPLIAFLAKAVKAPW